MTTERSWPVVSLGELVENLDSARVPVKAADRRPGPYPYYGASGIVDQVDDYLFDGEYLLVAEDGENLRTRKTPVAFMARGKFWVNNHAHILRGNKRADTRFLMYALSRADVGAYLTGSTQPKLTQGALHRIPVPAPPLADQRRIADTLGALDDKIELNRRMNHTLESIARAVFKSWFVDFDPVRKKPEGGDTGLPPDLARLFPDSVDERTGLPVGWRMAALSECASVARVTISPSQMAGQIVHHFSIPAFDNGKLPTVEAGSGIKSSKSVVEVESVLMSRLNPRIPRVWLPRVDGDELSVCSTEFMVLSPTPPFTTQFLYGLIQSQGFATEIAARATGTSGSHQRVRPADALSVPVVMPNALSVAAYSASATPMLDRIAEGARQNQVLAAARDALLSRLLDGFSSAGGD